MKTRDKIFTLLSKSDTVLSGEAISRELGISRVSVWKHVRWLINAGIPITASAKGYMLEPDEDSLTQFGFGDRKDRIHVYQHLPSTMDQAATLARGGCPDFTVVVAERQTRGRGRLARVWLSTDGGLYFTVVVRPDLPIDLAHLVNLAAAVEISALLRFTYSIDAWLKWPNDILVDGRKICGCLSQMEIEGGLIGFLSIGIGLNVNNDPGPVSPPAVSMKQLLGRAVSRRKVLLDFLERFEARLSSINPPVLIEDWKRYNNTIGREVSVVTATKTYAGRAVDIDDQGGLVVEHDDGSRETVIYGDCFYN
jgi:BirA family biotin operon repressor/biotin-[acetyl-CoA-carboxylase] ligase